MKVIICVLACASIVLTEPPVQYGAPDVSAQYGAPSSTYNNDADSLHTQAIFAAPNTQYGVPVLRSNSYEAESEPANYNFKYEVKEAEYGNDFGHQEERHGDEARGTYYVQLPDGKRQIVEYTADHDGYKPRISYEETNNGYGARGSNGGYQYEGYSQGETHNGNGY